MGTAVPPQVNVVIEVPRGSFLKRGSDGALDFVSPFPCPFNYGSVEGYLGLEGDMLDAVVLGPRLSRGSRVKVQAFGAVLVDVIDKPLAQRFRDVGFEEHLIRPEDLTTNDDLVIDGVDVSGHWSTFIEPRVVTDYNEAMQDEIEALPGCEHTTSQRSRIS